MNRSRQPTSIPKDDERARDSPEEIDEVRRAACGELDAQNAIYRRYNGNVLATARGILRDRDDAFDVVQETFVRVFRSLHTFKGESKVGSWILRIAKNASIDQLRRRRPNVVRLDGSVGAERDLANASYEPLAPTILRGNPMKELERREIRDAIADALADLSPEHREVWCMYEWENLSYAEISRVAKVPKGTIMSRLFHARQKLQKSLGRVFGTTADGDEHEEGVKTT